MSDTVLTAFVIVACLAIVLQAAILAAHFFAVKKTGDRMETMAKEVESRTLPLLDSARSILDDSAPRLNEITTNLSEITGTIKSQVTRLDATVSDLVDRSRLQIIRVDELVTRTMDKVEQTTDMVQTAVVSPVKQLTGIVQGISAGLGAYISRRRRAPGEAIGVDDEELFI
jgi:methyl-accepting chemotaxis protein